MSCAGLSWAHMTLSPASARVPGQWCSGFFLTVLQSNEYYLHALSAWLFECAPHTRVAHILFLFSCASCSHECPSSKVPGSMGEGHSNPSESKNARGNCTSCTIDRDFTRERGRTGRCRIWLLRLW